MRFEDRRWFGVIFVWVLSFRTRILVFFVGSGGFLEDVELGRSLVRCNFEDGVFWGL